MKKRAQIAINKELSCIFFCSFVVFLCTLCTLCKLFNHYQCRTGNVNKGKGSTLIAAVDPFVGGPKVCSVLFNAAFKFVYCALHCTHHHLMWYSWINGSEHKLNNKSSAGNIKPCKIAFECRFMCAAILHFSININRLKFDGIMNVFTFI